MKNLIFTLFLATSLHVISQNHGNVDISFNYYDSLHVDYGTGTDGEIFDFAKQVDGKIIAVGDFQNYNGVNANCIFRLMSDGSLDTSFKQLEISPNDFIKAVGVQSDGKIIIAGKFSIFNGISTNIIRLLPSGLVDVSFNQIQLSAFLGTPEINKIQILLNDEIIIGGHFNTINGFNSNYISKFTNDGIIDSVFNNTINLNNKITDIDLFSDESIFLSGEFTANNLSFNNGYVKLLPNGQQDLSFNVLMLSGSEVAEIQPDNKVITASNGLVSRLDINGSIDPSFNTAVYPNIIRDIKYLSNHEIIAVTEFKDYYNVTNYFKAFDTLGNPSTTFNLNINQQIDGTISSIIETDDNTLLFGGVFEFYFSSLSIPCINISQINLDGTTTKKFHGANGFRVYDLDVQPDNKIVFGGAGISAYNEIPVSEVGRLLANGYLDTAFVNNLGTGISLHGCNGGCASEVYDVHVLDNGKILVAGKFDAIDGHPMSNIARLNADGTIDLTFTPLNIDGTVFSIDVQNDDKILIGGGFDYSISGSTYYHIVRLHPNGTIDPTFSSPITPPTNSSFKGWVFKVKLVSGNKILISRYDENYDYEVTKLNSSGTYDPTFNNIGSPIIYDFIEDSQGNYILGGKWSNAAGGSSHYITKTNSNGVYISSFSSEHSTVPNNSGTDVVYGLKKLGNNNILVLGRFLDVANITAYIKGCFIMDEDGNRDPYFDINEHHYANDMRTAGIQSDGKLIVGGNFYGIHRTFASDIARLKRTNYTGGIVCPNEPLIVGSMIITNPQTGIYIDTAQSSIGTDSIVIFDATVVYIDTSVTTSSDSLISNSVGSSYSFQWVNCDNGYAPLPNETNRILAPNTTGNYALIVSRLGCSDTTSCFTVNININTTNLEEDLPNNEFIIFPNPASDHINVVSDQLFNDISLTIFNSKGQVVKSRKFSTLKEIQFNITSLESGIYFLELKGDDFIQKQPIVIE